MRTLVDTEHLALQVDDGRRLAVFRRKGTRITRDMLDAVFAPLEAHRHAVDRAHWGILMDLRDAPLNNDEAFEDAMRRHVERTAGGFRRRAILVKSAVGVLQVNRASRSFEDATGTSMPEIFRDAQAAVDWLTAP